MGFDEEDERCTGLKLLLLMHLSYMQVQGITRFYVPIDAGIGLYASEFAVYLMETNNKIRLYSLIPYEEQAVKWSPEQRNRYYAVQEQCTESILIFKERTPTCELDSMLEAIDQTGHVLAISAKDQPQDRNYALALGAAELLGRGLVQRLLHLQDIQLAAQHAVDERDAAHGAQLLEHELLLPVAHVDVLRDEIRPSIDQILLMDILLPDQPNEFLQIFPIHQKIIIGNRLVILILTVSKSNLT